MGFLETEQGKRLQKFMETEKISQQVLADKIGMSRSQISAWINGHNSIPKVAAIAIEAIYNLNQQWLMIGVGEMFHENSGDSNFDSEIFRTIIITVEELFNKHSLFLKPTKKVDLIFYLYQYIQEEGIDLKTENGQKKILELVRLAS
jgi:transcriptional regulator with XRE-family HTH domain